MGIKGITTKELTSKIIINEPLFILDVRNEADYTSWKIEGRQLESLNIPYFDLLDGVDEVLSKLPTNKEIIVVCAKEGSSIMVAEMLAEKGITVSYLVGGMKAWSEHLEPLKIADLKDGGELYQFVRIGKGCLSYMIISGGKAAIVDAARMVDIYTQFAKEKAVQITDVFDTHLHADHISGGRMIAEQTGATYWLPPKDATDVTFSYEPLAEGSEVMIGHSAMTIQALYSPGHTIGSTSFIVDGQFLLSGDILFVDSIGRPDLAGMAADWVGDLRETLYIRYKKLTHDLIVLPAHFTVMSELNEDGTVYEKLGVLFETNHGLQMKDEHQFRKLVTENLPPEPNAYQEIRQTNMGKLQPSEEELRAMEIGPNRCAIR